MGIFGRKRRGQGRRGRHAQPEPEETEVADASGDAAEPDEDPGPDATDGPYDIDDAPDDGVPRMDLGSVRVPVPEGAQVQVEMDRESGKVRAVHVVTAQGQATISAYAAPRGDRLWPEVSTELAEQLRADGGTVKRHTGEWGRELAVTMNQVSLYFIGHDGPRWMLRGVIAGPSTPVEGAAETLRSLMRDTIVVRGSGPMPVRSPLPITLPEAMAEHIAQQQQAQQQHAQQ